MIRPSVWLIALCVSTVLAQAPPPGFSLAAASPYGISGSDQFGQHVAMALDGNGDPVLAFLDAAIATLYFVSWNRATGGWNSPATVDTVGSVVTGGNLKQVSIARDPGTNLVGIAYIKGTGVWLATSADGGVTWNTQLVSLTIRSKYQAAQPTVALARGQAAVSYYTQMDFNAVAKGMQNQPAAGWFTEWIAPLAGTTPTPYGPHATMALDADGNVCLAAWLLSVDGGLKLAFWRQGFPSVMVTDTQGIYTDNPEVQLSFSGSNPRIVFYAARDNQFANGKNQVWSTYSNDGGLTWTNPAAIPNDGVTGMGNRISLALSQGGQQAAVVSELWQPGPASEQCGQPKLSIATDFIHWGTCSPAGGPDPAMSVSFPATVYGTDGTPWVAFQNTNSTAFPAGVVVWRPVAPQIAASGIGSSASFQTVIAPGSLFSIFGSNLALAVAKAFAVPLPANVGGTQVFVNGTPVPLLFVSPGQVNAQAPTNTLPGQAAVVIRTSGGDSLPAKVNVASAAPGIFQFGQNRAIVQNYPDYSLNDSTNPAAPGSVLIAYLTGQGALDNPVPVGQPAPSSPLSRPLQPVTATVGGQPASVLFAGLAPGMVGVLQVNFAAPQLAPGDYPLIVSVGSAQSNSALISIGN